MSDSPKLTVKEFDELDRPREKATRYGIKALSKSELLALILRTGTVTHPITEICKELLGACDNQLTKLVRKTNKELCIVDGIGPVKAQQIEAINELMERFASERDNYRPTIIKSSKDIYENLRFDIGNLPHEEIWMLSLSQRHAIIDRHILSKGSYNASVFDVRMALKHALIDEAIAIVLAHNHPSGQLFPSPQDDNITRALKRGAESISVRLLDHVIVTNSGYYSYNDEGRL